MATCPTRAAAAAWTTCTATPTCSRSTSAPTPAPPKRRLTDRFLDIVERIGNALPDPTTLFDLIVPKYLETVIYDSMISSLASEMASRRMAMKGATDAASLMSGELKRIYNRARQESITKELLDIVGGATAVQ